MGRQRQPASSWNWASSNGINRFGGATEIRQMQPGFPARLTSTFDSTNGYSWEQLALDYDGSEVTDVSAPLTGNRAFTPDNNEGLASGTNGWLEPDSGGLGHIFIPDSSGTPGSLNVNETGGGHLVSTVTALLFDQSDGFRVTSSGAHIAQIDMVPASASLYGVVTTTSQTFAGLKTFQDGAACNSAGLTPTDLSYALPTSDLTAPAPYAATLPSTNRGFLAVSDGFFQSRFGARENLTASPVFTEVWLETGVNLIGNNPGVFVLVGNYATYSAATGNVHVGITTTKTVKDGTGTNQTVTIKGGIITDWT